MKEQKNTAILLANCPDNKGIVSAVTDFLFKNNGNIIDLDQYVDQESHHFFMRVEWDLNQFEIPKEKIHDFFGTLIGEKFRMEWDIHFTDQKPKMAIFVTKLSHCLYDILQRHQSGEWHVDIPLIISNHHNLSYIGDRFDIPFHVFKITKENKAEQEAKERALLREHNIDFIVLARYMQIISSEMIAEYPKKIINIHHSFLPAFPGAKPYHQAYQRGVKIVGATGHYVTEDLDEGPIIIQDIARVSHKDSIKDLVRQGKDLEKTVLSQAIWAHLQHKVLAYNNRTIVF